MSTFAPMQQFSSTQAKQCFGQMLEASASGPVAIEKHGKVKAVLASPEYFARAQRDAANTESRAMARLQQAMVEQRRLIRHQRIALDLAMLPANERNQLIAQAKAMVARWKNERICSQDYVDRWQSILNLAPEEMAAAIISDMDGWGTALRQNSPWAGVHA